MTKYKWSNKDPHGGMYIGMLKKKKKSMPLEQGHYTSILNKGQNCLKWFSKNISLSEIASWVRYFYLFHWD